MKKRIIPFLAIATLLAACGEKPNTPSTSTGTDSVQTEVTKYTITVSKSSDYTVEGLAAEGYEEGATVTFTVTVKNDKKEVDKVIVDGTQLVASDGTYKFEMPNKNVAIVVQLKDKAGVKVATVTVDNESPKVGDVVNVTLKLDNVAVTEGVTVTATTGADLVTIEGSKVTCNKEGAVALEVTATVDGIAYKKDVTFTIGEGVVVTSIKTIQDTEATFTGDTKVTATYDSVVTVEGRVINTNADGALIYDGTAVMVIRDNKITAEVGKYVRVSGTPTRYKAKPTDIRWWQIAYNSNGYSCAVIEHAEIALPTVSPLTLDELKAYTTPAAGNVKLVSFTGTFKSTVGSDGKTYNNVYFDGYADKDFSLITKLEVVNGLKYNFEGYIAEAMSGKHINFYATKAEHAEMTAVESVSITNGATASVEAGKSLQLTASVLPATADPRVTWSTSDATKATVSETGEVTGVAEGTAVIKVTTVGKDAVGAAKEASITVAVTPASTSGLPTEGIKIEANAFGPSNSKYKDYDANISGIAVTAKKLIITGTYSPWKRSETTLDHDLMQFKKAESSITTGTIESASKVTLTVASTFKTTTLDKMPSVVFGASNTAATTSATDFTGTEFASNISYESYGKPKTDNLYRYVIEFTLTGFENTTVTVKSSANNATYVESILIA